MADMGDKAIVPVCVIVRPLEIGGSFNYLACRTQICITRPTPMRSRIGSRKSIAVPATEMQLLT